MKMFIHHCVKLKMFPRNYRSQVFVGNWEEDRLVEEERKQQYLRRLRNGELLSQKLNHITTLLYSPESTSVITDGVVHHGDTVKICHSGNGTEFNVALASDVPLHSFLQPEPCLNTLNICAIKDGPTVKRNTFTIKHEQENRNYRRPLCFGETFFLSSSVLSDNWYIGSRMITFGNSTKVMQHQEMFLSPSSSFYTQFKVIYPDQRWAVEKEGSPVPVNEHVMINHVFTNQALALESAPTRTFFGEVYEVSTHTYINRIGHQVDRRNLWKFTSAFPSS